MIRIEIRIKDIDYGSISDRVLPVVIKKLNEKGDRSSKLAKLLLGMKDLPGKIVKAALSVLPQQTKEELTVYFLTEYKNDILNYINQLAVQNEVDIDLEDIIIDRKEGLQ
jgi:hypothetical protein